MSSDFNQKDFVRFFKKAVKERNTQGNILYDGWKGEFARCNLCRQFYQIHMEKEGSTLYMCYDSHLRDIINKQYKEGNDTEITGLTLVF
ncbi:MAG TPA: hypothetical protein VMC80_03480 [Patescibacteria group bacterium]|nr:hypothetical protein [Patescibacteria group bacterium]